MIRREWKIEYEIQSATEFGDHIPATKDEVDSCESGKQGPGDATRLDFNRGWERSRWNKIILQRIYNQILVDREEDGGWGLPDVSEEYIMAALYGQLKRAREAWSQFQPRLDLQTGNIETPDRLIHRVNTYTQGRLATIGSRSRRKHVSPSVW